MHVRVDKSGTDLTKPNQIESRHTSFLITLRCTEAQLVQTKTPWVTQAHTLPGSLSGASQSAQLRFAGSRSSRSSSRACCCGGGLGGWGFGTLGDGKTGKQVQAPHTRQEAASPNGRIALVQQPNAPHTDTHIPATPSCQLSCWLLLPVVP